MADQTSQTPFRAMDEEQRRRQAQEHDAALNRIHTGVRGLRQHGEAIHAEVSAQNELIDDIGNRMDDAHGDLEHGEDLARVVTAKKRQACRLYGVIVVLAIADILVWTL